MRRKDGDKNYDELIPFVIGSDVAAEEHCGNILKTVNPLSPFIARSADVDQDRSATRRNAKLGFYDTGCRLSSCIREKEGERMYHHTRRS